MSPKQWLALFFFYISYLFFGASVFYHIEHELEAKRRAIDLQHRIDINEILVKYTSPNDTYIQDEILRRVTDYCGKPVTNYTLDTYTEPLRWSFYHAFFFSFTVCSTVGYGNISPSTTFSQMFMICYALIGIPVNGFLFAYLGEFFGRAFFTAYERYKSYKMATSKNYAPRRLGLIAQILLYLLPGIVIFVFLPSLIFSYFEEWPYTVSLYYSFVTLSTIGFGDFVPTFAPLQEQNFGIMFHIYEVFIIFWFIFGLGYLVMIMGFIAKGLRSKHLTRLEHQLAENIKATQSRIWNGVTKDVGYLRRIINEVYLMKFKPVYTDSDENETYNVDRRSSSCPDLSIYRPDSESSARKRAQSVFYPDSKGGLLSALHRVQSDSDLSRIDKKRTFGECSPPAGPVDLLTRVVTALGSIKATDDDAHSILDRGMLNGFSGLPESDILASEKTGSHWSLAYSEKSYAVPPPKARGRAASEFRAPCKDQLFVGHDDDHKWTWSGNNAQIKEFVRMRKKHKSKDLYRASFAVPKNSDPVVLDMPEPTSVDSSPPAISRRMSIFDKLNPFKKRSHYDSGKRASLTPDKMDIQRYLERTSRGRESRMSISPRQYLNATTKGRCSTFSILSTTDESNADLLEHTTIADLIRALEAVHTKANTADAPLLQDFFETPKRKLGTASLTPPSSLPPLMGIFPSAMGRRGSIRPPSSTQVPLFPGANMGRRQSNVLDHLTSAQARRLSLSRPPTHPPPYSETTPRITHRRFSVRPTALSIPPGQAPPPPPTIQASSTLQRRLSMRPNPLTSTLDSSIRSSGRFTRSISNGSGNQTPTSNGTPSASRQNLQLYPLDEAQNVPETCESNLKRSESK